MLFFLINCTKWKVFHLQTAQNGKFFAPKLHKMESFYPSKLHKMEIFCLSRNYLFLLFLTEPEVFEPKAIKHTEDTELTLRVPFGYFSLPQMTQITQIFLSLFF